MFNQGYRPPSQQPYAQQQPPNWQAPNGYGAGYNPNTAAPRTAQRAAKPRKQPAPQGGGSYHGGNQPPRPKRRSLKWQLVKVVLVLLLLAGSAAGIYVWKTQADIRPYTSVFLDNVYVDGINLAGMSWEDGNNAVMAQINSKLSSWYVRLKHPSGSYKDITAQTLGISRDPTQALEQAWAVGHDTSSTSRKTIFELKDDIQAALSSTNEFSSVEQSGDTSKIDEILNTLEKSAYQAPADAVLLGFDANNTSQPFSYQNEVIGRRLNTQAIRSQILNMVETFTTGEILIQTEQIMPTTTVAQLQEYYTLRFRAVTPIDSHSTEERNNNIRLAFSKMNGMTLNDGEKFSFNGVVGRRTQKNGFYQAYEYNYGELTPGWGGGVCQASTTVYLAAAQAGLKITDHTSHSTSVSYTEMGKDATVSDMPGHTIDFVFRNNTGSKVFLSAHVITDPNNRKRLLCEVRIYGKAMGNTRYDMETELIEVLEKPLEPEITEDVNAQYVTYTDEEKIVTQATEGYVYDTYIATFVDGVQTDRSKVARSIYKNRKAKVYVGVTPREF